MLHFASISLYFGNKYSFILYNIANHRFILVIAIFCWLATISEGNLGQQQQGIYAAL